MFAGCSRQGLRKEVQFNRKVALKAELRVVQTEIDRLSA